MPAFNLTAGHDRSYSRGVGHVGFDNLDWPADRYPTNLDCPRLRVVPVQGNDVVSPTDGLRTVGPLAHCIIRKQFAGRLPFTRFEKLEQPAGHGFAWSRHDPGFYAEIASAQPMPLGNRFRRVEYRLDVVPIGVKHERTVVVAAVLRAHTGRSVVATPMSYGRVIPATNRIGAVCFEGNVRGRRDSVLPRPATDYMQRELVIAVDSELDTMLRVKFDSKAKFPQRRFIHPPTRIEAGHANTDVVDKDGHDSSLYTPPHRST